MANDRQELICDLAETYGIYDYRKVPVKLLGTLSAGLGINTRIGMKRRGVTAPSETILLAQIFDLLTVAIWSFGGKKGSRPESQLDTFRSGYNDKRKTENRLFRSGRDFETARNMIIKRFG